MVFDQEPSLRSGYCRISSLVLMAFSIMNFLDLIAAPLTLCLKLSKSTSSCAPFTPLIRSSSFR